MPERAVSLCLIFNPFPPLKKFADKCHLKPWVRRLSGQYLAKKNQNCPKHCISLNNISRGDYFFLRLKRGRLFEGGNYFKCCSLEVVPQIFCFIIPLYQKIITSNKLHEYGPFKCSKFGSLIVIFRAWIVTDQFCWIRFHFNLTGRG